jgi:hypothetical protein
MGFYIHHGREGHVNILELDFIQSERREGKMIQTVLAGNVYDHPTP